MRSVVHLLCNFASWANPDIFSYCPPKQLHGLTEWHPEGHLLAKHFHWNARANNTQRCFLDEKKCLESAHVSWIWSQARLRVLMWTEEDVKTEGRNLLSARVKKQKLLMCIEALAVTGDMSRQSQQVPLFVQMLLAVLWTQTTLSTFVWTKLGSTH